MRPGDLDLELTGNDESKPPVVLLHGLTFDRTMWAPLVASLGDRRVMTLDLPGHGVSARRDSYAPREVAEVVHEAVTAAGLSRPVVVGHSIGGLLATVYAAHHPARAVLNIDQPLLVGPFREMLQSAEPVLRGPDYLRVWNQLLAGMGLDELEPSLRTHLRSTPRQDLLLGYWQEVLDEPSESLREQRSLELTALQRSGTPYHYVSRNPVPDGYEVWLRDHLPDIGITVLPGSGHFPHLAQPEALVAILAGWD